MSKRITQTARQEIDHVTKLTTHGIESRGWLYPIKGLIYYLSHHELWKPLMNKLVPTLSLGTGITLFMFLVTYLPQMAIMAFTSGPLAAMSAALLVLSESSTLTMILSKSFLIEGALVDTFDATLLERGQTSLVSKDRTVKAGGIGNVFGRMGKLASKPFAKWSPDAMIKYVLYLPLNLIPVVGTGMFVVLQGKRYGPHAHQRYFQLKAMNASQREQFVEEKRAAFTRYVTCSHAES